MFNEFIFNAGKLKVYLLTLQTSAVHRKQPYFTAISLLYRQHTAAVISERVSYMCCSS